MAFRVDSIHRVRELSGDEYRVWLKNGLRLVAPKDNPAVAGWIALGNQPEEAIDPTVGQLRARTWERVLAIGRRYASRINLGDQPVAGMTINDLRSRGAALKSQIDSATVQELKNVTDGLIKQKMRGES